MTVARATWEADKHPRDAHGHWINVHAHVRLSGGASGHVTRLLAGGRVEVLREDGRRVHVGVGDLTVLHPSPGQASPKRVATAMQAHAYLFGGLASRDAEGNPKHASTAGAGVWTPFGMDLNDYEMIKQDAVEAKRQVTADLERRLAHVSTADLLAGYERGAPFEGDDHQRRLWATSQMVQAWATSSNDSHADSIAMQEIAAEHFGMTDAAPWPVDEQLRGLVDEVKTRRWVALTAFLDAQYAATQEAFRQQGITHLPLYRGYRQYDQDGRAPWDGQPEADLPTRPISSWSSDSGTAHTFAEGLGSGFTPYLFHAEVPVEQVLSSARTGLGCLDEREFTVLGPRVHVKVERLTEAHPDAPPEFDDLGVIPPMTLDEASTVPAGVLADRSELALAILAYSQGLGQVDVARQRALTVRAEKIGALDLIPTAWGTT